MADPSDNRKPWAFKPAWASDCLCGSGRRFHTCCRERLPGFDRGVAWLRAAQDGEWGQALLHVRADVTQYTIWHRSHVAPPGRELPDRIRFGRLFEVDIAALSEQVGHLVEAHFRLDRGLEIHNVLRRLVVNIDDERWRWKLAYHHALAALLMEDRVRAARELKAAGAITPGETDVDLLQIHIDLHWEAMGFSEREAFYRQVVSETTSRADRLQYGGALAHELLLINDEPGARDAFLALIEQARRMEEEKSLSDRAEIWFCLALERAAVLTGEVSLFDELIRRLTTLLENRGWTDLGLARLYRSLGDAHRFARQYPQAIAAYDKGLKVGGGQHLQIFQAECLMLSGDHAGGLALIAGVDTTGFDRAHLADYALTYYVIALAARDLPALEWAEKLLVETETPEPYFETLRLKAILQVREALVALRQNRKPDLGPGLALLQAFSRYVQLQPNVAGIGLNVNNMIDDYIARETEKASRAKDGSPAPRV